MSNSQRFAKIVLALLFGSSLSVFGYGQRYTSFRDERDDITETAKYKIGPFWIRPTIGLRDVGRDGNVFVEREDQGPTSDYTFTVFSSVKTSWLIRRSVIISVLENPEYVHYFEVSKERGWNNVFSPEIRVLLLRRFAVNGSYLSSQTRYRATAEFDARVNVHRQGIRGGLFYETPRGSSLGITAASEEITYGDSPELSIARSLNRTEQETNVEFFYRIMPGSFFFLRGGYKEYSFADPLYRWRDAHSYQASTGIQFPIVGHFRGALSLGYRKLVPQDVKRQEFSGLIGNTNLSFRLSRFSFRLGFNRDSNFSFYADNVFFIENRWRAGVSFYLTRFLRLDYDFGYGRNSYPKAVSIVSPGGEPQLIKRSDLLRSHIAGVVIRIIKNTGIGLAINYWQRESNISFEYRERLFWGAYLTYEF